MNHRCLYCYNKLDKAGDFHEECSLEFFGSRQSPELPYSLDEMVKLAKNVVERSVSVPGVQPKLSMSLIKEVQSNSDERLTVVGALGGNYIFKPPSEDYPEMPQNEHVTMRIAETLGFKVVPSSLIRLKSGELAYITRRIDRAKEGHKIHMLDMFQILESYNKYKGSMEQIGKALTKYSSNTLLDKLFFFELTLFSFLTGNNDMHLKNFSMIYTDSGWLLSPAYDLLNVSIVLPEDPDELALTIEGKRSKFNLEHFVRFGEGLGLTKKQIERVLDRLKKNKSKAIDWVANSFLSEGMKAKYLEVLEERYRRVS